MAYYSNECIEKKCGKCKDLLCSHKCHNKLETQHDKYVGCAMAITEEIIEVLANLYLDEEDYYKIEDQIINLFKLYKLK